MENFNFKECVLQAGDAVMTGSYTKNTKVIQYLKIYYNNPEGYSGASSEAHVGISKSFNISYPEISKDRTPKWQPSRIFTFDEFEAMLAPSTLHVKNINNNTYSIF